MVDMIQRAIDFATKAHAGQPRKYEGGDYIVHPIRVMKTVAEIGASPEVQMAAVLHDTIEDCDVTYQQIRDEFGPKVAGLVLELTDSRSLFKDTFRDLQMNRKKWKALDVARFRLSSDDSHTIKLADVMDNTPSIVQNDPGFAPKYVEEVDELIKVLGRGHHTLLCMASALIEEAKVTINKSKGA